MQLTRQIQPNLANDPIQLLQLLQLADSALPVGAQAHSFGLETLVADGLLTVASLASVLTDYMAEIGRQEASFCRLAHRCASTREDELFGAEWTLLNQSISALRTAREGRAASAMLGRRLLALAADLTVAPRLQQTRQLGVDTHYAAAFGLVAGLFGLGEESSTLTLLQQSAASLLAATQKLLPVGQSQVVQLLWQLKPTLVAVADQSRAWDWRRQPPPTSALLADLAKLRHASSPVRLFIS